MKAQTDSNLHCIVYMSTATKRMESDELSSLLDQSRKKNSELNITGMLAYSLGNIIQVLEGSSDMVGELYSTITKDSRHYGVTKLIDTPISKRSFSEWFMGFRTMSEERISHLKDLCQKSLLNKDSQANSALNSIKTFIINHT